jgi:hypothetical protein
MIVHLKEPKMAKLDVVEVSRELWMTIMEYHLVRLDRGIKCVKEPDVSNYNYDVLMFKRGSDIISLADYITSKPATRYYIAPNLKVSYESDLEARVGRNVAAGGIKIRQAV